MASQTDTGLMLRWWDSPALHRLVDENWWRATGCNNTAEYFRRAVGRDTLGLGLSIGCGTAEDEILLLEQGVFERLILCDISNEQLDRAEAFARERGIAPERIIRKNFVDLEQPYETKIDLIYWRHSLHHMFDTRLTLEWCRDNLSLDGAIYCNDACPPNRMQWGQQVLDWVELYRASLPHKYLRSPFSPDEYLPCRPHVHSIEHWQAIDPTECADSESIIPAIRDLAPCARIDFLGGCIYALALDDILNNFREKGDEQLLADAMLLDRYMSSAGMNFFFTCVIKKSDFI